MDFNLLDIVQHILNIVVLYIILRAILYKPVRKYMLSREEALSAQRGEADAYLDNARELMQKNEKLLDEAHENAQQIVDSKMEYGEHMAQKIVKEAHEQAERILADARARIRQEESEARSELVDQTAALAVDLATQIIGREIDKDDNARLIDEYFRKVG